MANSASWQQIFDTYSIHEHCFEQNPYIITAEQIKKACQHFTKTTQKEVRILCKQDSRCDRPDIFIQNELFILPINNGTYAIIKGEGYVDIPPIISPMKEYRSSLDFNLESSKIGDSEMQHLDFAYASSLIRTFMNDSSLVLTIRGRKYTPEFSFNVNATQLIAQSVQTEVDAGYEGRDKIVLIEAKNAKTSNTIIRQLYYPFRQWGIQTQKEIFLLFFEKREREYHIWQYGFSKPDDYNSIELIKSKRYIITQNNI